MKVDTTQVMMAKAPSAAVAPPSLDIQGMYALLEAELLEVKASLTQIVPPDTELLAQTVAHTMQARGKMLRPLLTLMASGASGQIDPAHVETAAVAELIHVATLLHDDVLDDADLRRGKPTIRSLWGNKVSILSGDYLLAQASLKLSRLNNCRLVSIFAIVLANLCEGEVEQIRTSFDLETTWDSYFKKSICKTASLFAACCESAGVLNQLDEADIQRLRQYGEYCGIAFQIIDDLLDYTSSAEQLGKPVLDDLKNGILNAPVLLALEAYAQDPTTREKLIGLIEALFNPPESQDQQHATQEALLSMLNQVNIVDKTQALADDYTQRARDAIAFLPQSPYKDALNQLSLYITQRNF